MSGGHLIDVFLVLAAVGFGVSGYRQGFVTGLLSFVGFVGGGYLGTQVAPAVADRWSSGGQRPVLGVITVLLLATVGQVLAVVLGQRLRAQLRSRSSRTFDSVSGAVLSVVAVLLVAWLVATPLASSRFTSLAGAIRNSSVIAGVNSVIPDRFVREYAGFRHLVGQGDFPDVFGPLAPTDVAPAQAPSSAVLRDPDIIAAGRSVLKIVGEAPSCSRRLEGSGFVIGQGRVLTNAHVVAGVTSVAVQVSDGRLPARVVLYDAERDLAVLAVPGLSRPALSFAPQADRGADAAVAGYPLDGPYTTVAARVRSVQDIKGPDIYNDRTVTRQIYALRAEVRSGNSGGPLLATDGRVLGVVFAAAADDPSTGFALTAAEASDDVRAGLAASSQVGTGSCD